MVLISLFDLKLYETMFKVFLVEFHKTLAIVDE